VKNSFRQPWLAPLAVIIVAVVIAACGQIATTEEQPASGGIRAAQPSTSKLTQSQVCPDGQVCAPTGAHQKHANFDCKACHAYGGWLAFQNPGPAYLPGSTGTPSAPSFNATTKTCSNVACHSVPAGTFTYWFPYDGENLEQNTVPYGGSGSAITPSWYATGAGCTACHDLTYQGTRYTWHSGYHGNPSIAGMNACATCHLDATGTILPGGALDNAAINTATNCPPGAVTPCASYHANQVLNVTPKWGNCGPCH